MANSKQTDGGDTCRADGCKQQSTRYGWCEDCDPLTDKQRGFVDQYIASGFNATKAAKRAGYSEDSSRQIGSENLSKPDIRAALSYRCRDRAIDADTALAQYSAIAMGIAEHPGEGYKQYDQQQALETILELHGVTDGDRVQVDLGDAAEQFAAIFGIDLGE